MKEANLSAQQQRAAHRGAGRSGNTRLPVWHLGGAHVVWAARQARDAASLSRRIPATAAATAMDAAAACSAGVGREKGGVDRCFCIAFYGDAIADR